MPSKTLINFLFLLLYRHRAKHLGVFVMAILLIFMLSSVMLTSQSIKSMLQSTLQEQSDFVIQKMRGGRSVETPMSWVSEFAAIEGVTRAVPRVYGQYFYEPNEQAFTIVGIDFFDAQASSALEKLVQGIDIKSFLERPNMIIGPGVKTLLDRYHFFDYYVFRPPNRSKLEVNIYKTLDDESALLGNDVIIMEMDLARKILGIAEDEATDIALSAPNPLEADNIYVKLVLKHFDTRIIQKRDIARSYERLYNYKGGLFLFLFMSVLATFMMLLYQRYNMLTGSDKREIGILRSLGWSIQEVIWLKLAESAVVALSAFMLGFLLSYLYVFFFNAPLLREIFLGFENLANHVILQPALDMALLGELLLIYLVPFMAAVLIPSWRAAITDPLEAMR